MRIWKMILAFALPAIITLSGCMSVERKVENEVIDYREPMSWLSLPDDMEEYPVDVFFVYPTVFQGTGVQDITDIQQIEASREPLYTQASVFGSSANIYAPLYRQLGKAGFGEPDFEEQLLIGENDIKAALLFYLEHYNKGKPFIIAGHSQGSSLLISLLSKIWGKTGAEERMLATYIIGYSITEDDIHDNSAIRMSEGPYDTGCFISYNTILEGAQDKSVQILPGALVTNPLSWVSSRQNGEYVAAEKNLGAVFFTGKDYQQTIYPNFTSAQAKDGGLVCEPNDKTLLSEYPIEGICHRDDYSLFYKNIEANVAQRIDAYFSDLAPDYSHEFNWASKPETREKPVDVFYVYPTIYAGSYPRNMSIANAENRTNVQKMLIAQAGVYAESANLFAPYYRQESMLARLDFEATGKTIDETFQLGYNDVENAFAYYLEHLNNGRPFILAGHSQGTLALIELMKNTFDNAALQDKLVAAYLIGFSLTKNDLAQYPWMKIVQSSDDVGRIITFNTEAPGAPESFIHREGAIAVNPLSWTTTGDKATSDSHLGAKFFSVSTGELLEEIDNFSSAQVDTKKGVLLITDMKSPMQEDIDLSDFGIFPNGIYHKYDYSFWYNNLSENVKTRIAAYLEKH